MPCADYSSNIYTTAQGIEPLHSTKLLSPVGARAKISDVSGACEVVEGGLISNSMQITDGSSVAAQRGRGVITAGTLEAADLVSSPKELEFSEQRHSL